jgi:hypothetical protein
MGNPQVISKVHIGGRRYYLSLFDHRFGVFSLHQFFVVEDATP